VTDILDPLVILAALGQPPPDHVTAVAGGWDTSLWQVERAGRRYALRVFRPEQAETSRRELIVMHSMSTLGLPVPTVHAAGVGQGRPALLLSWCAGRQALEEVRAKPWRLWRIAIGMGRMHARIHLAPVADEVVRALPRWAPSADDLGSEFRNWRLESADVSLMSVLHLDFHPLNVMTDGRLITGVLDWANAAVGDPRADLARTVTLFRLAPIPPDMPTSVGRPMRTLMEAGWRMGYRRISQVNPFVNIDPFYAWAGAFMERDLRPKLGRPGVWLQERDLARIRKWTVAANTRAHSGTD
jgi:aminoglycoside phosphotransferase (APT) family kinase protein